MSDTDQPVVQNDPPAVGVVLPNDNRARVPDTSVKPYIWVGRLATQWKDGSVTFGTATLIDDYHALTCAHNLYDSEMKWYRKVIFSPAMNRSATHQPIAPWNLAVAGAAVPEEYQKQPPPAPPVGGVAPDDITEYLWDYGVVRLAKCVPDQLVGTEFQVSTSDGCAGQPGAIIGYSGDLDPTAHTQYTRTGTLRVDNTDDFVTYQMSTYHGDSGAAVYWQRPGRPYKSIVAVHVTGVPPSGPGQNDGLNFGPALDPKAIMHLIDESDRKGTLP